LLANGDELNLNLPKFARSLYFFFFSFFLSGFLALPEMIEKKIKENSEHFCILVCYFFNAK